MPPTSAPGCSTQYRTLGRCSTRCERSAWKTDVHTARDVHLSLERQPDVRGHLAAPTVGADDVLGANCRTGAGDSITHLHVHAVGVLGEAQILGVETDPAAPGCRVPHDDRLQQRLRDIAVEGRARLDVVRLARRVRSPRPHPAQLVAGEAGAEHGFAHQLVRRGLGQHVLLDAEIAKHLHRALIGDVGARRVRRPPVLGQHHVLDPEVASASAAAPPAGPLPMISTSVSRSPEEPLERCRAGAGRGVGRDGHDGSVVQSRCFWCKHDVEVDLVVGTVDGTAVGRGSRGMFGGVDDQAVLDAEYRVGRQVLVARDEDVRDQGAVPGASTL